MTRTMFLVGGRPDGAAANAVVLRFGRDLGLSEREIEVLGSAAMGKSMKETATGLGISGKTVEYFWARIYRKAECRSQLEVMSLLLRFAVEGEATFVP